MNGEELIHGQNHTHLPLLALAINQTTGDVLELGTGHASTVNLHAMLAGSGRRLYSYDSNPDWIERFASLRTDWHSIILREYTEVDLAQRFGVVLIDHAPMNRRVADAIRLKDSADQIIIHDTDAAEGTAYEAVWPHFVYRVDDRRYLPWTTAVSNVRKLVV